MWNAASGPATVVEILSPGGLESYFEELAPILAQHGTPPEYYELADNYGITIQDDWIEDLERASRLLPFGRPRGRALGGRRGHARWLGGIAGQAMFQQRESRRSELAEVGGEPGRLVPGQDTAAHVVH